MGRVRFRFMVMFRRAVIFRRTGNSGTAPIKGVSGGGR
jgi:hypothetical protein